MKKDSKAPFSVQFAAAKDNLDRTGYKVEEKVTHEVSFLTAQDLEELNQSANNVDISYMEETN
jgi:hypothetical protein